MSENDIRIYSDGNNFWHIHAALYCWCTLFFLYIQGEISVCFLFLSQLRAGNITSAIIPVFLISCTYMPILYIRRNGEKSFLWHIHAEGTWDMQIFSGSYVQQIYSRWNDKMVVFLHIHAVNYKAPDWLNCIFHAVTWEKINKMDIRRFHFLADTCRIFAYP